MPYICAKILPRLEFDGYSTTELHSERTPNLVTGCAVLKLSDGRKRSMSLWVEFITASGYLSARKIRSRFQTLVAQACDKSAYRDVLKMVSDTSEVKLRIRERYVVQVREKSCVTVMIGYSDTIW